MVAALVQVNGVTGSNDRVDAGDLVTLTNVNDGDETTYQWSFLSRPPGASDTLTGATTASATFTPSKEGTYLIRLLVDGALATRREDRVVVAVRYQRTGGRPPGLGESTEVLNDSADFQAFGTDSPGWHKTLADLYRVVEQTFGDTGRQIVYTPDTVSPGSVVAVVGRVAGTDELEAAPIGGTTYSVVRAVDATSDLQKYILGVVEDVVQANYASMNTTGPWAGGCYCLVRFFGKPTGFRGSFSDSVLDAEEGGSPSSEYVYVSDTGTVSRTPGTYERRIGVLLTNTAAARPNRYFVDGLPRYVSTTELVDAPWSGTIPPTSAQTTDATTTTLLSIPTTTDKVHSYKIHVSAGKSDRSEAVSWDILAVVTNAGGVCVVRDTLTDVSDGGASGWLAVVDISGTSVRVRVTGAIGAQIDWCMVGTYVVHGS